MSIKDKRSLLPGSCIFFVCMIPFCMVLLDIALNRLGANPLEKLHQELGDQAMYFLCITMALTPFKQLFGLRWPIRFRRMLGLFCFFYATLHFLVYFIFDLSLSWEQVKDEIPKSPYIMVGLVAYSVLIILAATSSRKMQKKLGKRWKQIHQTIYLVSLLVIWHFLWAMKLDLSKPILFGSIIVLLLGVRLFYFLRKKRAYFTTVVISSPIKENSGKRNCVE